MNATSEANRARFEPGASHPRQSWLRNRIAPDKRTTPIRELDKPVSRLVLLLVGAVLLAGCLVAAPAHGQEQNLGHKLLGTNGVNAGVQIQPGLYAGNGYASFSSNAVGDQDGRRVPGNNSASLVSDWVGVVAAYRLEPIATFVGLSVGVPVKNVSVKVETADVRASADDFGLGDLYVQPLHLGWRLPHLDIVTGFGVYIPTGHFEPGGVGTVGAGQWTRELSLGGTVYFDDRRMWRVSALSSDFSDLTKRDVDIRRGESIQVQGGVSVVFDDEIQVGLAGYGLWQVGDNSGSELPAVLRGARDQAYGLGPEVAFDLVSIRSKITLRYEHDVAASSRPFGQTFVFGYSLGLWSP